MVSASEWAGRDDETKDPRGYEERGLRRERRAVRGTDGGTARALGEGPPWWGREGPEAAQGAGQAARAPEDRAPARPRHGVPRAFSSGGFRDIRRKGPRRGDNHGDRTRLGARGDGGRQRRDRKRWHLLSDDGKEAPQGAGNRGAELPALHLSRGLGWSVPAAAG